MAFPMEGDFWSSNSRVQALFCAGFLAGLGDDGSAGSCSAAVAVWLPAFLGNAWLALLENRTEVQWIFDRRAIDERLRFAGPSVAQMRLRDGERVELRLAEPIAIRVNSTTRTGSISDSTSWTHASERRYPLASVADST